MREKLEEILGMVATVNNAIGVNGPSASILREAGRKIKELIYQQEQFPSSRGYAEKIGAYLTEVYSRPEIDSACSVKVNAGFLKQLKEFFDAYDTRPAPAIGAEALEKVRELASQIATMRVQTGGGEDVDSRAENSHRKFLGEKILALLAPHGKG